MFGIVAVPAWVCMGVQFFKKITRVLRLFVPERYWSPTPVNQNVAMSEVANELYISVTGEWCDNKFCLRQSG